MKSIFKNFICFVLIALFGVAMITPDNAQARSPMGGELHQQQDDLTLVENQCAENVINLGDYQAVTTLIDKQKLMGIGMAKYFKDPLT